MIPRMAARCTTPAAAMHHFGGMGAPFQRWLCTIICGQVALFERRTHQEYMALLERAPVIHAAGLREPYRALAEFNGTVLAGRQTDHGAKFVTWDWSFNHTSLNQGNYYEENYVGAKQDFAVRSGLVPCERQFTPEQLIEIYQQCSYVAFSCALSREQEEVIQEIQDRIQDLVPDCRERIIQSLEEHDSPGLEPTM